MSSCWKDLDFGVFGAQAGGVRLHLEIPRSMIHTACEEARKYTQVEQAQLLMLLACVAD